MALGACVASGLLAVIARFAGTQEARLAAAHETGTDAGANVAVFDLNATKTPLAKDASIDGTALPPAQELLRAAADRAGESHLETPEGLRALAFSGDIVDAGRKMPGLWNFKVWPGTWNQGRKMPFPLAGTIDRGQHAVAKATCLAALGEVQSAAQKAACNDEPNMVPLYAGGDIKNTKVCIDAFEFPNAPCELPLVWGSPKSASILCEAQGKRLCTQDEWNYACGGDPAGGQDWRYAYGDEPDHALCNTQKPHPFRADGKSWVCSVYDAKTAWETCATETEPAGAFPKCRSRFGVYDLHGNVAEMMTRTQDGDTVTQLKGSAFFYVDVARRHDENQKPGGRETYPDHCKFDPRWHVERLETSTHSNYHLGFRCCKSTKK